MAHAQLTRRAFLGGSTGLIAALAAGCGSESGASGDSGSLTFLNEETDPPQVTYIKNAIAEYKQQAGYTVTLAQSSVGATFQKLVQAMQAGDAYDLSTSNTMLSTYLAEQGSLRNLDPSIEKAGGPDAFVPNSLVPVDGSSFQFPYNVNNMFTYFRTDLLSAVDEDVPRTWDDLSRLLKKLKAAGKPGIAQPISTEAVVTYDGSEFLWANHVEFWDQDGNVILDEADMSERCVESLEFLKEIAPYIVDGMESAGFGDVVKSFVSGSSSVVSYTGRVADTIIRTAPDLVDKFTVAGYPTPTADMIPSNAVFINGWIIPENAQEAGPANDFLDWFVKEKFIGFLLCNPFNTQPTLKSIYGNEEWLSNESLQKHPEMVKTMEAMVNENGFRSSGIEVMPPGPGALKQKAISDGVVPGMFQKIALAGDDPKTVVKQAADQLRSLS